MSDPRDWQQPPQDPGTQGWPAPGADPGTQGLQVPPPGTQGWQAPPPGTQGSQAPPPSGTQGFQVPPPGTQGWQAPPRGSQPWPASPPGTQAFDRPPDESTRPWTGQPATPPPPDPTASGWFVAGSGGWQRPPELPTLVPPDERRRDPEPRQQPVRRSSPPLLAPMVALLGLVFVTGGTVLAAQQFDLLGTAAGPTATADATIDPNATEEPIGTYDPNVTDDPNATDEPFPDGTQGPTGPTPVPTAFATPPPNEQASVAGTLLYTRSGDIWQVQGTTSSRLVESGEGDALMPVWSPDGKTIYYIQRRVERGKTPPWGRGTNRPDAVTHMATDVMSVRANGNNKKRRFQSMQREGQGLWSTVAIQPEITPDGERIILVSDLGEVPSADFRIAGVVLSSMSTTGRNLRSLGVASRENNYGDDLGHNDPDLSPNGRRLAFTYADKGGGQGQGTPRIGIIRYPVRGNGKPNLSPRNRPYANPDWSPDGRYLAAERVTPDKRDIVILDPNTWAEVARLTKDGRSFAPVWSPNGDQIAYLHVDGLKVDVHIMTLEQGPTGPTLKLDQAVTVDGDVDPESAPAWFIPPDQRRAATPAAPESDGTTPPEGTVPPEDDQAQ